MPYTYKQIEVHIKRMDLFAVLTLSNPAGRRFVTTMDRGIKRDDQEVCEMIRRFRRDKKVVQKEPYDPKATRGIRGPNRRKKGVASKNPSQGEMI